jgi:hypothetical protein
VWGALVGVSVIHHWLLIAWEGWCLSRHHFAAYKSDTPTASAVWNPSPLPWMVQLVTDRAGALPLLRSPIVTSFYLPIVKQPSRPPLLCASAVSSLPFLCRAAAPLTGTTPPSTNQVMPSHRPASRWSLSPPLLSYQPSRCAISYHPVTGAQSGCVAAVTWSCWPRSTRDASTITMPSTATGEVPSYCHGQPCPALPVG